MTLVTSCRDSVTRETASSVRPVHWPLEADVLVPKLGVLTDERAQEFLARWVIQAR
jgi:hypothetical protein